MIRTRYEKSMNKGWGFVPALLVLVGLAFLITSMAGMLITGMSMGMGDDMQGNMQGCPFMLGTSICHMSLFEHIASWQTMFAATGSVSNILLALLLVCGFGFFLSKYFYPPPRLFSTEQLTRVKRISLRFVSTLLLALSGGILNPKLF